MDLAALSRGRRILSAAVALSAVGLVTVKTRVGADASDDRVAGWVLASCFMVSLGLLIAVWRKEHAASELAFQISDQGALRIGFGLAEHEGVLLGGSSGVNVAGAMRLAKELGPGHTIVTILCDSGVRYASKLFNPAFLREKNLPVPEWMERRVSIDPGLV